MLQTSEDQVYQPHVILRSLAYEQEKPEERDRNFRLFLKSGKHHCIQYQFVFCQKHRSILIIAIPICMTSQKNVTSALKATFDRDQKSPRIPPPPPPPTSRRFLNPAPHARTHTHTPILAKLLGRPYNWLVSITRCNMFCLTKTSQT